MQKVFFPPSECIVATPVRVATATPPPARDRRAPRRDSLGLAYLVRLAAQRIRTERGCEYCSDGKGCHVCAPASLLALSRYTAQ